MTIPETKDFEAQLKTKFSEAEKEGLSEITLNARELHRQMGGYPNRGNHRMNACCNAMHNAVQKDIGDVVIEEPPSGQCPSLTIKYKLPRRG